MDEQFATRISVELRAIGDRFNALNEITMEMPDDDERRALRLAIGQLMADLDIKLARPLGRQFPRLDPFEPR